MDGLQLRKNKNPDILSFIGRFEIVESNKWRLCVCVCGVAYRVIGQNG